MDIRNIQFRESTWSTIWAPEKDVGDLHMSMVWARLESNNKKGDTDALQGMLKVGRQRPDLGPRAKLEETMLQHVRARNHEGPIKKLLFAVRIVEKGGHIPRLVREGD